MLLDKGITGDQIGVIVFYKAQQDKIINKLKAESSGIPFLSFFYLHSYHIVSYYTHITLISYSIFHIVSHGIIHITWYHIYS
jgi:hypothetical protein